MSTSFLEIIRLTNGDIVLKRTDDEGDPLVSISFSEETKNYVGDAEIDVAKVMIQAGIQAAAHINDAELYEEKADSESVEEHTLH